VEILIAILGDPYIKGLLVTLIGGLLVSGIAWVLRFIGLGIPIWLTTTVDAILNVAIPRIIAGLEQKYKVEPTKKGAHAAEVAYDINQRLENLAVGEALRAIPGPVRSVARILAPNVVSDRAVRNRVAAAVKDANEVRTLNFAAPSNKDLSVLGR
jgi:hypothetical protein